MISPTPSAGTSSSSRTPRGDDPLIKRVIALPGDDVQIQEGILFINGLPRQESYVNEEELRAQAPYGPMSVPEGHAFVMGDNRTNSRDSRFIGPIPYESIEGEAFMLFWPPGRIGLL